jgi:hypothetical protein
MQMQLTDLLTIKRAPSDRGRPKLLRLARAKSLQVEYLHADSLSVRRTEPGGTTISRVWIRGASVVGRADQNSSFV